MSPAPSAARFRSRSRSAVLAISALSVGLSFHAFAGQTDATASPGARIAAEGLPSGAPPCGSCHGEHGEGQDAAGIPRLAGLNAAYLARQLESFTNGTRDNAMMTPIAKTVMGLAVGQVADFYAGLQTPATPAAAPTDTAAPGDTAGAALAERGDWSANLPACASCHGPHGLGVGESFPAIAGQSPTYIANQLQAWRAGTRHDDPMGLMHAIATRLSDGQIAAVAAYYAAQSAPPGSASDAAPTNPAH